MGSSPVSKSGGLCVEVVLFFFARAFNEVRRRAPEYRTIFCSSKLATLHIKS